MGTYDPAPTSKSYALVGSPTSVNDDYLFTLYSFTDTEIETEDNVTIPYTAKSCFSTTMLNYEFIFLASTGIRIRRVANHALIDYKVFNLPTSLSEYHINMEYISGYHVWFLTSVDYEPNRRIVIFNLEEDSNLPGEAFLRKY